MGRTMVATVGSMPRYIQIAELLARDIAASRLIDGERLPPEREMAVELGVAVGTLRRALAELQSRGLLERTQGSGNYVRAANDPGSVYSLFRLELIAGGGLPTAEILSVNRAVKPAHLPPFGTTADAFRIRRLRRLSGAAAALEEIWLDGGYAESLAAAELSDSLYLHYRRKLGLWIVRAEDQIGLGSVPDWTIPAFAPAAGTATPLVTRVSLDQHGARAEASLTWFDPDVARYVARWK